ncbi:MAG: hypothetical protein WC058_09020 [Phycisphaeraceae bacterium]
MAILATTIWSDQLYWWMALGATALFVLKMVFSFIGGAMDHGDFDVAGSGADADVHDGSMPADHGSFSVFTFFSLQSLLAFFMGMGWMGVVAGEQWAFDPTPTLLLALAFGMFLLALNGVVMLFIRRLHCEAPMHELAKQAGVKLPDILGKIDEPAAAPTPTPHAKPEPKP